MNKSVRFRRQLVVGYSALLAILAVTGVASVIALRVSNKQLEHVAHDLGADLGAIQRLRYQTESAISASRRYLLTGDETSEERFARGVEKLDATMAGLDQHSAELVPGMQNVHAAVRSYVETARSAMAVRSATHDPREIEMLFENRVAPVRDRLETTIADFVTRERAACDAESARADKLADSKQAIVVLATVAGVVLSMVLASMWTRKLGHGYALERLATETARAAVAARDEMLAIVSHDLRNPLTTIKVGASLVQMDDSASPHAQRAVRRITEAANRMEHLIDELLDVAKLDAGKLELDIEPCPVASLFEATKALFDSLVVEPAGDAIFTSVGTRVRRSPL